MNLCEALKRGTTNQLAWMAMVSVQLISAGMGLISKAAFNNGMNPLVFVAYRQIIATLFLAPFALTLERKKNAVPLSFRLFCKIFLLALCGATASLDFYFMAVHLTSATYTSAILNIAPVVTFIMSVLLRLEPVGWSSIFGMLKIIGMVISVGGAMVLSFYQGSPLKLFHWHNHHVGRSKEPKLESTKSSIEGVVLMFLSTIAWSIWLIMQSKVLKVYPTKLRLATLQCLLSSIQSFVVAAAFDRNFMSWRIGWNLNLISLAYGGVLVTLASYGLQVWCIEHKGPFYVAMFSPLSLLATAIFSTLVLAEQLYYGSLLGGILIVGGLYCVLWSRSKEQKNQEMLKSETFEKKVSDVDSS